MAEESSSTKKVFLKKDQREACWKARDTFWKCMNTNEQDGYSISILVYRRKKLMLKIIICLFTISGQSVWRNENHLKNYVHSSG